MKIDCTYHSYPFIFAAFTASPNILINVVPLVFLDVY